MSPTVLIFLSALLVWSCHPMKTPSGENIDNGTSKLVQRQFTLGIGYLRNGDYQQFKEST